MTARTAIPSADSTARTRHAAERAGGDRGADHSAPSASGSNGAPSRPQRLLSPAQACEYLGITPRHLRELIYRREIPVTKVGRSNRFDVRRLERWIEDQTTDGAA